VLRPSTFRPDLAPEPERPGSFVIRRVTKNPHYGNGVGMVRAVIFDFNGVLIDDEQIHFELFREVLAQEGVALTERQYHERYLGLDDRGCFEVALAEAGQPVERGRIDDLIARKARRYVDLARSGLRIFPGAAECLVALSGRWPLAIYSGALRPEIEFALDLMRVRDRIAFIVSAEDTTRCKPDPQGYLLALDGLRAGRASSLEPGACLVIEDSLAGIASAKAAGMHAVGVTNTYPPAALRGAGADALCDGLVPLTPSWIDRTFGP
jgi:beta-phosphoglucomutase